MACSCENKRMASEEDRMRRLAKAYAVSEGETVCLYRMADGTYGFCVEAEAAGKEILEYVTPY